MVQPKTGAQTDLIIGRNSVMEALRAGRATIAFWLRVETAAARSAEFLPNAGKRESSSKRSMPKSWIFSAGRAIIKVLPPMLPLMPMLAWRSS